MLRPLFNRSNDVKKVGITDLRKNLSRYLKRVKAENLFWFLIGISP